MAEESDQEYEAFFGEPRPPFVFINCSVSLTTGDTITITSDRPVEIIDIIPGGPRKEWRNVEMTLTGENGGIIDIFDGLRPADTAAPPPMQANVHNH